MRIDPYLMFNGQCEAAFKFYQQCLGGTIKAMLKFSDAPKGEGGEDAAGGCGPLPPGRKTLSCMLACRSTTRSSWRRIRPLTILTRAQGLRGFAERRFGPKPNASSPCFLKKAQCRCRWARPSGLPASACLRTNSACRG